MKFSNLKERNSINNADSNIGRTLIKVNIDEIVPNDWNQNYITEEERKYLLIQMKKSGPDKTPPIIVRKITDKYQIVDGEQRWRVAKALGWQYLWAEVVEIDEIEAIRECLSLNILRGRIHPVRLYFIVKKWPEVLNIIKEIDNKLAEQIARFNDKLTEKALEALNQSLKNGIKIDCEILAELAKLPSELQYDAALAVKKYPHPLLLRAYIQKHLLPYVPPEEAKALRAKTNVKHTNENSKKTLEEAREIYKLPKISAYAECGACGQPHIIYYNQENGSISMKIVKRKNDIISFEDQEVFPKILSVKCPHGTKGIINYKEKKIHWLI